MIDSQCVHDKSVRSTLHTAFSDTFDSLNNRFYWVYCDVCNKHTDLCVTPEEAVKRGLLEFWKT